MLRVNFRSSCSYFIPLRVGIAIPIREVNVTVDNREILLKCLQELAEEFFKTITCNEGYGLKSTLKEPDSVFWLKISE